MIESNVIHFSNRMFQNLIFIPVTLNDITVTAMFDTGANMSFINESTIKQLSAL